MSENLSEVNLSPYNSVQMSELYVILMGLVELKQPLTIVTDSQYVEIDILHIDAGEFSLMIQNGLHYLFSYKT